MNTTTNTQLETRTCRKCRGTGIHGYNMKTQHKCFECAGEGRIYTQRGKAAADYLDRIRSKPAGEIKISDLAQYKVLNKKFFFRVERIEDTAGMEGCVTLWGTYNNQLCGWTGKKTDMVLVDFTHEEKQQQYQMALAYQATLTAQGTPKKLVA